jgi:hypothetical protein
MYVKGMYLHTNNHLYNLILNVCDDNEWNDMIIQFAEHSAQYATYLTPSCDIRKIIRLISKYGNNYNKIISSLPLSIRNEINSYELV